ncbi:LHT2 [Scenedesmus sp. PABB004]|nr:LHT2 [Scenedesmus sp. PABB004]
MAAPGPATDFGDLYATDEFRMYAMKVLPCSKRIAHNWQTCVFAHWGEKARRRDLRTHNYSHQLCVDVKRDGGCPRGDACHLAHNIFESWLHPELYRTQMCTAGAACARTVCFFAHSPAELRTPTAPRAPGGGGAGGGAAAQPAQTAQQPQQPAAQQGALLCANIAAAAAATALGRPAAHGAFGAPPLGALAPSTSNASSLAAALPASGELYVLAPSSAGLVLVGSGGRACAPPPPQQLRLPVAASSSSLGSASPTASDGSGSLFSCDTVTLAGFTSPLAGLVAASPAGAQGGAHGAAPHLGGGDALAAALQQLAVGGGHAGLLQLGALGPAPAQQLWLQHQEAQLAHQQLVLLQQEQQLAAQQALLAQLQCMQGAPGLAGPQLVRMPGSSASMLQRRRGGARAVALVVAAALLVVWRCSSGARDGGPGRRLLDAELAGSRLPEAPACALDAELVAPAIAAAFAGSGGVAALAAPARTDDHAAEHDRPKDANELAINALFAGAAANLTALWAGAVLPRVDAGCASVCLTGCDGAAAGAAAGPRRARAALLLVSDARPRLAAHLDEYGVQLASLWHYAHALGYALEVYTHGAALPPNVTGHFAKLLGVAAMFEREYDQARRGGAAQRGRGRGRGAQLAPRAGVLGLDWDMYIHPASAVPLSAFFAEAPSASGEDNLCTGAVLYRNTPAAAGVLSEWWAAALGGCCWRGPLHDQVAFKHVLLRRLAAAAGEPGLYPAAEAAKLAAGRSPHGPGVAALRRLAPRLREAGFEFGFVGLEMGLPPSERDALPRVGLHSCHGLFWGCIPADRPALLMHTGHKRAHLAWIRHRMLAALARWLDADAAARGGGSGARGGAAGAALQLPGAGPGGGPGGGQAAAPPAAAGEAQLGEALLREAVAAGSAADGGRTGGRPAVAAQWRTAHRQRTGGPAGRAGRSVAGTPLAVGGRRVDSVVHRMAAGGVAAGRQAALLFVDTQNYNCHRGGAMYRQYSPEQLQGPDFAYWWSRIDDCTIKWQQLQQAARSCGIEVIYTVIQSLTRDGRDRGLDYKISGFHVPPGCWDARVVDALAPAPDEIVLPKTSSSVFTSTPLDYVLRNMDKRFLLLAGAVTDQCVAHAAKDAADLGFLVTLVTDCCATYSADRHLQACTAVSGYCRQRTLDVLLEELVAVAGAGGRGPSAAGPGGAYGGPPGVMGSSGGGGPLMLEGHGGHSGGGGTGGAGSKRPYAMWGSDGERYSGDNFSPGPDADDDELNDYYEDEMYRRPVYFEYAKSQWENDEEFLLPNGLSWVEIAVRGDPLRFERGLIFCRLCRGYDKNNTFAKGYRSGKRSALKEHLQTRDHCELVAALMEGLVALPDGPPPAALIDAAMATPDPAALAARAAAEARAALESFNPFKKRGRGRPSNAERAARAALEQQKAEAEERLRQQLAIAEEEERRQAQLEALAEQAREREEREAAAAAAYGGGDAGDGGGFVPYGGGGGGLPPPMGPPPPQPLQYGGAGGGGGGGGPSPAQAASALLGLRASDAGAPAPVAAAAGLGGGPPPPYPAADASVSDPSTLAPPAVPPFGVPPAPAPRGAGAAPDAAGDGGGIAELLSAVAAAASAAGVNPAHLEGVLGLTGLLGGTAGPDGGGGGDEITADQAAAALTSAFQAAAAAAGVDPASVAEALANLGAAAAAQREAGGAPLALPAPGGGAASGGGAQPMGPPAARPPEAQPQRALGALRAAMPTVVGEPKAGDLTVEVEDPHARRTANWLDVAYHSVTGMVGAGVLGLPAVFSHLGWAGGVIMLLFSFWVSWYTYKQLVYMHEVPDLDAKEAGGLRRMDRYDQLSTYILGKRRGKLVLMPFQLAVLVGIAITYTVVGGDSLAAFSNFVSRGGTAYMGKWPFYVIFGGLQLLLSLLPSFNELSLVSLLGAIMSVAYCTIAVAMSATVNPPHGSVGYDPMAVPRSPVSRTMGIFNAISSVLFAYGGHNVALEIQATIPIGGKHPASSVPAMMRGVNITFVVTGLAYFGVSIVGFWAFGIGVADNVLLSFTHGPYSWVVAMADMFVVVHVAAAYQVYTQPVFQMIEVDIRRRTGAARVNPFLATAIRLSYVAAVTVVGIVIPFFSSLMGLVGAIAITPTTFLLPPLFWLLYKQPERWGLEWAVNVFLVGITGVIGVLGTVGSIYSIAEAWGSFKVFA